MPPQKMETKRTERKSRLRQTAARPHNRNRRSAAWRRPSPRRTLSMVRPLAISFSSIRLLITLPWFTATKGTVPPLRRYPPPPRRQRRRAPRIPQGRTHPPRSGRSTAGALQEGHKIAVTPPPSLHESGAAPKEPSPDAGERCSFSRRAIHTAPCIYGPLPAPRH